MGTGVHGGWRLGICIILIVDFLDCLLLKNNHSGNMDSSVAPASKYRSLPSNDHPRTLSGTEVQGGRGWVYVYVLLL